MPASRLASNPAHPPPPTHEPSRREALRRLFWGAGGLGGAVCGWSAHAQAGSPTGASTGARRGFTLADIGPLGEPDASGLCLPEGVSARVVAVSGERPGMGAVGTEVWHTHPDGGATFVAPGGGWTYVNNSEVLRGQGGVGALDFDRTGRVLGARRLLSGTSANCAGGATPWGTWLSAEEVEHGLVWECDPFGAPDQREPRPALGTFKHEAVAVDPVNRTLYLTEDEGDGRFYRFVCSRRDWPAGAARPALRAGRLQVLQVRGLGAGVYPGTGVDWARPWSVEWVDVIEPQSPQALVRRRLAGSAHKAPGTVFLGGEGLWYFQGVVYFSTKGDNRIWALECASQRLQVIHDFATASPASRVLSGVDNLTVSSRGDVLVAEDGGNMELCVILPDRRVKVLMRVVGQDDSELTGPAFSPDGRRLYVNSQRGGRHGLGLTYELLLPA